MATVTGLTAARMQEIADASIVSGVVNELGSLILTNAGGTPIDAGAVMDPLVPGTTAQYYRGDKTWQTLDKAAAGLSDVDNTSDLLKPASTAQAAKNTNYDKIGGGLVAIAESAVNSGTTSGQLIVLNIPTFTFLANRWYEIEWTASIANNTGPSVLPLAQIHTCAVADSASSISGLTERMGYNCLFVSIHVIRVTLKRKIKFGTNTTLQIKALLNGSGQTCNITAGAGYPSQLSIVELGAII